MPNPIVVKFMAKKLRRETMPAWRRQLPDQAPEWGACRFEFDPEATEYDWLVAYDDLSPVGGEKFSQRVEPLACARERTILVTAEPSSIKCYSRDFCAQFGLVISHHEPWAIEHTNVLYSQTGYPWFYGRGNDGVLSFNEILDHPPREKASLISTVCSAKQDPDTLQRQRFTFTARLQEKLPKMDRFGKGVRLLDDKAEVLDGYRYHVTIENDVAPHYFTEKLVDPFLGLSLPFYFGCPNAADYFPEQSFIPIDIFDFEGSLSIIRNALEQNAFERRLPYLQEARRRVLEEHNLFALLAREIETRHDDPVSTQGEEGRILSRRALRNSGPLIFLRTVWEKEKLRRKVAKHRQASRKPHENKERA